MGRQQQADDAPIDVPDGPGQQRQGDDDLEQHAEHDADLGPVECRKNRRHHHGGAKAREAAHHAGNDRDHGSDQEGCGKNVRHRTGKGPRGAEPSIAAPRPAHHIMQAMPSKNLALPAMPLDMPYIQRRPEL